MKRKIFLAAGLSAALSACSPIGTALNGDPAFRRLLLSAESLDERVIGTRGLVREYRAADISRDFPLDSLATPQDAPYARMVRDGFTSYRLTVGGMVDRPLSFSLAQLEHMAAVSQITRHDCVEGWSAIAQWQGPRLSEVLSLAGPQHGARFVVFHCFDRDGNGTPYYESLSLHQAAHPQTLLALRQNFTPITPDRGAPVRLRVPTQLGYKSAKWVHRIELTAALGAIGEGKGGYWEDQGYEWYAGI